jgi:putative redox protein
MGSASSILATVIDPLAGSRIEATTAAGYPLAFETADAGAARNAPEPTESLLAALAACSAMDVASIMRKKRQRMASYQVAVSGEKSDEHPRIYLRISMEHRIGGEVEPEAVRRSIMLSATRYCPVNAILSRSATIEHSYRLRRDGHDEETALVAITGPEGVTVL